jgi:hypothetical protein
MPIDLRTVPKFTFPSRSGGPQLLAKTVEFPTTVRHAVVAINGFSIGYTSSDHELLREEIDASYTINNNVVTVRVTFALRDSSGNFDDPYNGFVDVVLIVDRD